MKMAIVAGTDLSIGLKTDGTVVGAGDNSEGQINVESWANVTTIASASWKTFGVKPDGTVLFTGYSFNGDEAAAGWTGIVDIATSGSYTVGARDDGTCISLGSASIQTTVGSWTDIIELAGGLDHTIGLKSDGTVVHAGATTYNRSLITGWTNIIAIAAGARHSIGLKSDGTVVAAGDNGFGQSAVTGWTDIVGIAAGRYVSAGIKSDGTVVGVGFSSERTGLESWTDITQVSLGLSSDIHALGLKSDGTVVSFGGDIYGQRNVTGWTDIGFPGPPAPPEPGDPEVTRAGQYTLTITGSPPELIPCANFLARMRSAKRSYLQATVPYTQAMADLISARPTADLELRFYDSIGEPHIVLAVKLDGIQITKGVQSSSIVLTGWRQSTNATPATHADIQAMTVASGSNSSTMLMPGYRPEIKPADTVQAEGVSFVAGLVTVQGAARKNDIEVRTTMSEEAIV